MMTKERIAELRASAHKSAILGNPVALTILECVSKIESLQARVQELERNREHMANVIREQAEVNIERGQRIQDLEKDKARLDWLIEFIFMHGHNGLEELKWSMVEPDPSKFDVLEKDSTEDLELLPKLDRSAIDAAMKGTNEH